MEFDYNKTYYKVTSKMESHHGFQYKDGLNILIEKFNDNPQDSCVCGGFYFADQNHILEFLNFGCWVREISIPPDAKVILDLNGDKWRTDRIILGKKYTVSEFLDFYFDNLFDKKKYNYKNYGWALPDYCSDYFNKWFDKKRFDYESCSRELAINCSENFDGWFDKKKFNYDIASHTLAKYCSNHFNKWFDKKRFNYNSGIYDLIEYCSKYRNKWDRQIKKKEK